MEEPVIDSEMSEAEAFAGLALDCPAAVRARQRLIPVAYVCFDGRLHHGQVVLDVELVDDVQGFFARARELRFPIASAIPIAHPRFREGGRWSDEKSMAANNSSAFNYRRVAGTTRLSQHALGRALDVNPRQNPYLSGGVAQPADARHDPAAPGTFTAGHPLVRWLEARGWEWGGHWTHTPDFHHFQKPVDSEA